MNWLALLVLSLGAWAQTPVAGVKPEAAKALTLENYLAQVRAQNPEARSMQEQVDKARLRLDEAEVPLSSEFYAKYNLFDDKNEPTSLFAPRRAQGRTWRAGVKDPTKYGLATEVYVESTHSTLFGANPAFILTEYEDSKAGVDIKQSLWRDGFGAATRAGINAQRAGSRIELLKRQFDLKNLMLRAENAYWNLVSLNQIVRLQEDNVGRAKKLNDWMGKRVGMRLVDDVDGLQAKASLEMRELDLLTSLDDRAVLARQFNILRGLPQDTVEPLAELPDPGAIVRGLKEGQRMTREDFRIIYEQAEAGKLEANAARSQIAPQLDLVGGVATNGLDRTAELSHDELKDLRNPTWNVGLVFSIPLDYSLIGNMKRSYTAATRASEDLRAHAEFIEERTWNDLLQQKAEAQRRFERALTLEKTQTELVKRERNRLMNGRTTTFQTITFEQNLASAQIQRVRSQVALINLHNVLKNWDVRQ